MILCKISLRLYPDEAMAKRPQKTLAKTIGE
jgi:hypothetical protein